MDVGGEEANPGEFTFAAKKLWGKYSQFEQRGKIFAPIFHNYLYGSKDHDFDDRLDKAEAKTPGSALKFLEQQVRFYALIVADPNQDRPEPQMLLEDQQTYNQDWVTWMRTDGQRMLKEFERKKNLGHFSEYANGQIQWFFSNLVPSEQVWLTTLSDTAMWQAPMYLAFFFLVYPRLNRGALYFWAVQVLNQESLSYFAKTEDTAGVMGLSGLQYSVVGATLYAWYRRGLFSGKGLWKYVKPALLAYFGWELYKSRILPLATHILHADGAFMGAFGAWMFLKP